MTDQERDEAAKRVAERSVADVANLLGVNVDAGAIVATAIMLVDTLKKGTWKELIAKAENEAAKITNREQAEEAARNRK